MLLCEEKIVSVEALKDRISSRGEKKLVHCHGCFDLLHPGHIHYFEFARRHGDMLLVSLNADGYFVNKGPGRPLFDERMRAIAIASLEIVDFVCIYSGFIPEQIFECLKPDIYVKGKDYDHSCGRPKIPEEAMVEAYGGKVVYGPEDVIFSSTELIKKLQLCKTKELV